LRAKLLAIAEYNVDARVILREAGDLAFAKDWDLQFLDPVREDALDVLLPEREAVGMSGREIAVRNRSAMPR
jgi:hypothetical protein